MNFHLAKNYIKHLLQAKNEHSLHSPFVFEFYNNCLKSKSQYYRFKEIENLRKLLLKDQSKINITDLGAGSKVEHKNDRKISSIAKNSLKNL